jgi:hypothetical protein
MFICVLFCVAPEVVRVLCDVHLCFLCTTLHTQISRSINATYTLQITAAVATAAQVHVVGRSTRTQSVSISQTCREHESAPRQVGELFVCCMCLSTLCVINARVLLTLS